MATGRPLQTEFLERLGFEANPFEFTNADQEPKLNEYFVHPPYFASVYGEPSQPASCMVFAPRGAGKSAQRKMVEMTAPADAVLCITYDNFRNPSRRRLLDMTVHDHLLNVARIAVVGLLTWIGDNRGTVRRLQPNEREALRAIALGLLSAATQAELREGLDSLRNLSTRAKELWNEHRWALGAILSSIGIAGGGAGGTLPEADVRQPADEQPGERLDAIGHLATTLGLQAMYVLVDRVDETQETEASHDAAYHMIAPLLHELRVLEMAPFAFKFFLPDYILPFFQQAGGRSDRIRNYQTRWTNSELGHMMTRRLGAHSDGRVASLGTLLPVPESERSPLVDLTIYFAQKSPRDLIRIWGRAVDEQLRIDASSAGISEQAVEAGIDTFCHERAEEVATAAVIRDLRHVRRVDFTVSEVASDVFHVVANAARQKIQLWENRGIVKRIGDIPAARGRPQHHYGVVDVRVARSVFPDVALERFLAHKARLCPECESWLLRDFDAVGDHEETCVECGIPLVPPK